MLRCAPALLLACSLAVTTTAAFPQDAGTPAAGQLDPTRNIASPQRFSSFHQPLPEQYIWTKDDPGAGPEQKDAPRYFRARFHIASRPAKATIYVAGPTTADLWVNGSPAGKLTTDPLTRLHTHVYHADVSQLLHVGENIVAIQASGRYNLVVKLVPAGPGVAAPPLLISNPDWKGTLSAGSDWQGSSFDDSSWQPVHALGSIEGNIDFFQWNDDAGLYDWPGYEGASPFLAHVYLAPEKVFEIYTASGSFSHVDALTAENTAAEPGSNSAAEFTVRLPAERSPGESAPGITLDFGREVAGRVQIASEADAPVTVSIAYGESLGELHNEPYLGVDVLQLPPHGSGQGPKSAFRYARIRFLSGPPVIAFQTIRLEDIYYPVRYEGSFDSSDPLLNRIWETGVYTSHLCMQDDIWDAPKRDRGRWMGDTDVSGRVIDAAFGDHFLLEDTLTRLIGPLPIRQHVNGIPGYSSFWFTELKDYYLHTGRTQYLESMHDHIVQLLQFMDADFDAQNHFINHTHAWLYVDWALDLNGDTPQSRETTILEYVRAYRAGAWLLRQLGDEQNAHHFEERAQQLTAASQSDDWTSESSGGSFGPRWQTNAMAVISGVARPEQYTSIWQNVLSSVGQPTFRPNVLTPYYGAYVLDALAETDHRAAALAWIREFWGGMIHEGATSFWEAYDPSWPKRNPHVVLQADNTAGYIISLAHGWSSAPSYWLMQQVLGITPTGPGFNTTTIRPDLIDLDWARGSEPTPHGLLKVDLKKEGDRGLRATLDVPDGVSTTVLFPVTSGTDHVLVNGKSKTGTAAENGMRLAIVLRAGGHYEIRNP